MFRCAICGEYRAVSSPFQDVCLTCFIDVHTSRCIKCGRLGIIDNEFRYLLRKLRPNRVLINPKTFKCNICEFLEWTEEKNE